ncbi:MAG: heme A synthase, partial [Deltaproteobacteria bacterium]
GLVTSTGSGLAVPDWPLSYGQFFPPMVGGIFFEHGHRLVAATVGVLTTILAIWLILREERRAVRMTGIAALGAVILQGVLGGLTVLYLLPTSISVAHACLGQIFFCITVTLALVTSPFWRRSLEVTAGTNHPLPLPLLAALTTGMIFLQLVLGALMRHTGAGLAIPDFPIVGGRLPDLSTREAVIHFAHRLGALAVSGVILVTFLRMRREGARFPEISRTARGMLLLLTIQVLLGIFTVLSRKSVAITTAHVATGALLLATSLLLTLLSFRRFPIAREEKAIRSLWRGLGRFTPSGTPERNADGDVAHQRYATGRQQG